jgi:hypothetical protein
MLAAVLLVGWLLFLALRFLWRYPFFTWHYSARRQLLRLRQRSAADPTGDVAAELSDLLRRIAIARCGREACAGLTGPAWLDWLSANDPAGFDWRKAGRPLLTLPYAPPGTAGDADALRPLIEAAIPWARRESRLPAWLRGLWQRPARV